MIYEFHKKDNRNVGDLFCNPSRYFDLGNVTSQHHKKINSAVNGATAVIGGGGLLHPKFVPIFPKLLSFNPAHSVIWGVGHNTPSKLPEKINDFEYYPDFLDQFDLVGVRDYIPGKEHLYLPCVSCMHPAFDKQYKAKHDTVYFVHANRTARRHIMKKRRLTNTETDFDRVIQFLGSGNTVVTNSYHGAYWAMLLGRKVAVQAWSVKFDYFKHAPCKILALNDEDNIQRAWAVPDDYLVECRNLNKYFYERFLKLTQCSTNSKDGTY